MSLAVDAQFCDGHSCHGAATCRTLNSQFEYYACDCNPGYQGNGFRCYLGPGSWLPFWRWRGQEPWPANAALVSRPWGSCGEAEDCFGQLPAFMKRDNTDLMASDHTGERYVWELDSPYNSPIADALFTALLNDTPASVRGWWPAGAPLHAHETELTRSRALVVTGGRQRGLRARQLHTAGERTRLLRLRPDGRQRLHAGGTGQLPVVSAPGGFEAAPRGCGCRQRAVHECF